MSSFYRQLLLYGEDPSWTAYVLYMNLFLRERLSHPLLITAFNPTGFANWEANVIIWRDIHKCRSAWASWRIFTSLLKETAQDDAVRMAKGHVTNVIKEK